VSKECVFTVNFPQATAAMVSDVSQKFFGSVTTKLNEKTNMFLISQGVDLQVLERAIVGDSQFFDVPVLRKTNSIIQDLQTAGNATWANFLTTVRQYAETKVKTFVFDIEADGKVFPATRRQTLEKLYNFDYAHVVNSQLQTYLTASQATIEKLATQQERILDGAAKNHLSEWYLDHIKESVDSFLVRSGFELDVIPDNYIDQAPKDLALVNKNWTMIRELLDVIVSYNSKAPSHHEVIDVMTSLMDDIYGRLDEFVRDSLFVISEQLGIVRTYFDVSQNQEIFDECRALFNDKKDTLNADLREKLDELIKDVEYVFKIREMEGLQQTQKSLDHVPVSGLIASRFFRLENELRTSLDVWDPDRPCESDPCTDVSNSLKFEKPENFEKSEKSVRVQ